jgi:hypothetical protein
MLVAYRLAGLSALILDYAVDGVSAQCRSPSSRDARFTIIARRVSDVLLSLNDMATSSWARPRAPARHPGRGNDVWLPDDRRCPPLLRRDLASDAIVAPERGKAGAKPHPAADDTLPDGDAERHGADLSASGSYSAPVRSR